MKTITWQSPCGAKIQVTPKQEKVMKAAGFWPRDDRDEEYCSVSHGLHDGYPTWTDEEIAEMVAKDQ